VLADLVVELVKLYQETPNCLTPQTELPQAIDVAAAASSDTDQQAQILEVRATVADCSVQRTAAIPPAPDPDVSNR
jgi:hypothetical protein